MSGEAKKPEQKKTAAGGPLGAGKAAKGSASEGKPKDSLVEQLRSFRTGRSVGPRLREK